MKKTIYVFTFILFIFSSCSKDEDVLAEQKVEISVHAFLVDNVYKKVTVNLIDANTNDVIAVAVTTDTGINKGKVSFLTKVSGSYKLIALNNDTSNGYLFQSETEVFNLVPNEIKFIEMVLE